MICVIDARDLEPGQAEYPSRIRALADAPTVLSVAGTLDDRAPTVAIVGTREPSEEVLKFTSQLAAACVRAGAVVVSGAAFGVDAAAHRGALDAGGRTWAVAPCGRDHIAPIQHKPLYRAIVDGGGAVIWPFEHAQPARIWTYFPRNRILVALADVVVVTQADIPSGALNAASWARSLGRPLWVVPASPWVRGFRGSWALLDKGARHLTSIESFLHDTGLVPKPKESTAQLELPSSNEVAPRAYSGAETAVLGKLGTKPIHIDELVVLTALSTSAAVTALLTLSLEHVLVEGPDGFFRRS